MKELHIDWSDSDTETREEIDRLFSRTSTLEKADNASCGWFKITGSEQELADALRNFASAIERAAEDLEASESTSPEGDTGGE